ncbi:excisionase [Streptomyces sp. cmx-18-6]|uniref:excisionase n=1 Tax=Streptomyces sp. cmx-18-6 TaxID=2790930 RepID=UPI0039803BF2
MAPWPCLTRAPAHGADRPHLRASTLYDLLRTRRLASLTIGRARRIPTHALADYVQCHLEDASR